MSKFYISSLAKLVLILPHQEDRGSLPVFTQMRTQKAPNISEVKTYTSHPITNIYLTLHCLICYSAGLLASQLQGKTVGPPHHPGPISSGLVGFLLWSRIGLLSCMGSWEFFLNWKYQFNFPEFRATSKAKLQELYRRHLFLFSLISTP